MVQLRKSRKSFRKTRGRKTRQRKNEKRKSRKTRSTRKTGGLGESRIENKINQLTSMIGELIKLEHDKEQKIAEIQTIFNWLIEWKLVRCDEDVTCQRKKMIYYYIAVHLHKCFIYAKHEEKQEDSVHQKRLIAKFEKHKKKYNDSTSGKGTPVGGDDPFNIWKHDGESKFISGIVKTLYDSILEVNERAVDTSGYSEGGYKYYGHVITSKILTEVEEKNINVSKEDSIFVKWIEQIINLKKIKKSWEEKKRREENSLGVEKEEDGERTIVTGQIQNRLEKWVVGIFETIDVD